ncbi:MAG: polyribonucleotide nucleotidyltransferase [Deltaproteobacteria bacterium CG11_big_fil_rev_8_21_14_0_20_49_13]|nr:MAG: polyribonucleotide nucleotidyltransferase [Deltaproteobacteria bacterium CG11_big_fil_rev_8_21_14_0_20_49_13]
MVSSVQTEFGGRTLTIETGLLAKQAGGAVTVRCGDSIVLVAATASKKPREGMDYFPLTVDYVEKTFAAGKIPGGFFKREGRPTEREILTSRFIDRPIRPLFPEGFKNDTQVVATVLSADHDNETDVLAMIGASAALSLSPAPFMGPIAGVCVGRVDGKFVCNPTPEQMERSDIDLIVAANKDAVVMVEGGAKEISEKDLAQAIMFAHKEVQPVIKIQEELAKKCGVPKMKFEKPVVDKELQAKVEKFLKGKLENAVCIKTKMERYAAIDELHKELVEELVPEDDKDGTEDKVSAMFEEEKYKLVRHMIVVQKKRIDGRKWDEVRNITCQVGLLPRTHGSALFTRGETQALVVTTLGTADDRQIIDGIMEEYEKRFMLHYNFPPYSVGETKPLRSPGRREIGHGALAERALMQMLPPEESFPYTMRTVSEILESNGSSSMATVCGGTLSLMDAGVPIKNPVAGIAMGLIKEEGQFVILSDILGDEDHLGDMDFKVAGTKNGITSVQMDIKIAGITEEILSKALSQALEGRLHILGKMLEALPVPREDISKWAPRIMAHKISPDKIGALIGPGGKNIRGITEETGVKIDVDEDGMVHIATNDSEAALRALQMVKELTAVAEVGKYYKGHVVKIMDFGAFVEVLPGQDGLLHISQIDNKRVNRVEDVLQEGDEVVVKLLEIDPSSGKMRLSRKEAFGHENEVEK